MPTGEFRAFEAITDDGQTALVCRAKDWEVLFEFPPESRIVEISGDDWQQLKTYVDSILLEWQ